jgi:hypothetical protein
VMTAVVFQHGLLAVLSSRVIRGFSTTFVVVTKVSCLLDFRER